MQHQSSTLCKIFINTALSHIPLLSSLLGTLPQKEWNLHYIQKWRQLHVRPQYCKAKSHADSLHEKHRKCCGPSFVQKQLKVTCTDRTTSSMFQHCSITSHHCFTCMLRIVQGQTCTAWRDRKQSHGGDIFLRKVAWLSYDFLLRHPSGYVTTTNPIR
jgi:hypothetical protein